MKLIPHLALLLVIAMPVCLQLAGCTRMVFDMTIVSDDVTEIGETGNTGLGQSGFEITLKRSGTAELTCSRLSLEEGTPVDEIKINLIAPCLDLSMKHPERFVKTPGYDISVHNLEGRFTGQITPEQFDRLAGLIVDNKFFSFADRYPEYRLLDAPSTLTRVIYASGKKEVMDQEDRGDPKLLEIENAIYKTITEINVE